jgi:hypothetical protein
LRIERLVLVRPVPRADRDLESMSHGPRLLTSLSQNVFYTALNLEHYMRILSIPTQVHTM